MKKIKPTPKMTKAEMNVIIDITRNNAHPEYHYGYSKDKLKALRKEKPDKYAELKREAEEYLIAYEYEEKILMAVYSLPKYVKQFDVEQQQKWIDQYESVLEEVVEHVKHRKMKEILHTMDIVYAPNFESKYIDDDMIPLVVGSSKYHMIIADAQNKVSTGNDEDELALQTLFFLGIVPEKNPFVDAMDEEYLTGELFPLESMGEIYGKTGNMKSFWLQHFAFCIAHGIDFEGQLVNKGRVIYVATEGNKGVIKRFNALAQYYNTEINQDMLRVLDATSIDLSSTSAMKSFSERLKLYGKSQLIIIDILEKAASKFNMVSGDGWNEIQRNMVQYIKPYVSVICWVTHPPKKEPKLFGGSGNRHNHSDFFYRIDRKGDELKNTLVCVKNKDGKKFNCIDYCYAVNEEFNTLVPKKLIELSAKDAKVLQLIKSGTDENEAIDLVYNKDENKSQGAIRTTRSRVKKRLEGLI